MDKRNSYTYPNLRKEMGINGMSINDLARYLNISVATARNKLTERTQFDLNEVITIAKLFNRPVEILFSKE